MKIEVLGPGCSRCRAVEAAIREVVQELGLSAEVEKVEKIGRIMAYGAVSTPAVVVDGKVVGQGRLFSKEELRAMLSRHG